MNFLRAIWLFLRIWRRRWKPGFTPIDARTAWKIASGIWNVNDTNDKKE